MNGWFKSGSPWVWLSAAAVSVCILLVVALLGLIAARGLVFFWPKQVLQTHYQDPSGISYRLIGEIQDSEEIPAARLRESGIEPPGDRDSYTRYLFKTGNRDALGMDFRMILPDFMGKVEYPAELMVVERREWGNLYGYLKEFREDGRVVAQGEAAVAELQRRLKEALELFGEIRHIEKDLIGAINYQLEQLRLEERRLKLAGDNDPAKRDAIEARRKKLREEYAELQKKRNGLFPQLNRYSFTAEIMTGQLVEVPLAKVVRVYFPNAMGPLDKIGHYFGKLWEFVSDEPREANTEGGIFPAIFGTVMMVLLMSVVVTPCGVVAAVYLREYARQGFVVRLIRIAVNNLAGVPSIVYGVFGLGFFVYFLGGGIDALFYPEALPSPTFGTPGILWSSITLALLTLPVVIVATEEGLARVPRSIREGSLALGATKAETLWRTVLPMASPAMMTGLILAVARAAGEVAPLMLVGVVKLAPSLPLDGNPPFLHLDRKFMHLGFHIYDVGFQSPNVEAARPLVYATSLLLILVIVVLNLTAIRIRNHLREKYRSLES